MEESLEGKGRKHFFKKAEELLLNGMPIIPVFMLTHFHNHQSGLHNYIIDEEGSVDLCFSSLPTQPHN